MSLLPQRNLRTNRKLPQRRPLRQRLPDPGRLACAMRLRLRRAVPALLVAAAAAGAAGLGLAGYRFLRTSVRFAVRSIDVEGNARVTSDELRRLSGIRTGANVFAINPRAVARAVGQNPWVARMSVARRLPDRIVLTVEEHQPAAVVELGGLYLATREGRLFKRASVQAGDAEGLVVVTGIPRDLWASDPDAGTALVRHALALVDGWRAGAARPPLGEVNLDHGGATLFTRAGAVGIRLGRGLGELDARLATFDAVWAALSFEERAAARTIYLDSAQRPDRVTVRLKGAG